MKPAYSIKIEPEVVDDIQQGINWYDKMQEGLGAKFFEEVETFIHKLKKNPHFQVRYDNVCCFPLKKFPYMIHFTIDEQRKWVIIRAILNTHQDPKKWGKRS